VSKVKPVPEWDAVVGATACRSLLDFFRRRQGNPVKRSHCPGPARPLDPFGSAISLVRNFLIPIYQSIHMHHVL
jgi:hypothetical protein